MVGHIADARVEIVAYLAHQELRNAEVLARAWRRVSGEFVFKENDDPADEPRRRVQYAGVMLTSFALRCGHCDSRLREAERWEWNEVEGPEEGTLTCDQCQGVSRVPIDRIERMFQRGIAAARRRRRAS